LEKLIT